MTPRSPGASEKVTLSRLGSLKLRSNRFVATFGLTMFTTGTLCAASGTALGVCVAAHTAAGLGKILRTTNWYLTPCGGSFTNTLVL